MDYIDGSGFWLASVGTTAQAPSGGTGSGGDYIPTFRPRRRAWWWMLLPWLWMSQS